MTEIVYVDYVPKKGDKVKYVPKGRYDLIGKLPVLGVIDSCNPDGTWNIVKDHQQGFKERGKVWKGNIRQTFTAEELTLVERNGIRVHPSARRQGKMVQGQ